ncbi:MAG: gluconokinase [Phycisphaerae bacterium]|nr:gluconokinase [Saprospiraceae bacterium]
MVIALDIGTTNIKAVAFSAVGAALAAAERTNQTFASCAGWSEQAPAKVFQNVLEVLSHLLLKMAQEHPMDKPRAIVFSSAMHGLVAVDNAGLPLTNFMLWSDVRAVEEARVLRQKGGGGEDLYRRTGVPIHPMSPLVKLIWLRKNLPVLFQKTHKFLGIKEFVWFRLTGKFESDISCASATGLMNLWKNEWDNEALAAAGISTEQLPILVSPTHTAMSVLRMFPEGLPLIIGASDGALANLGSGATDSGQVAITVGTSAAIRMMTNTPILDEQMRTFCYRLDAKRCIVGGASNNGTNALEWLRTSVFQSSLSPEDFANQAMAVPAGAEGLQFFPYLLGERAPLWDASARASFVGLTAQHTQAHFVRAVMEGVLINLKSIADLLEEKTPIQTIHVSGGFAHNKLWVSMLGEVFQKEIVVGTAGGDASVCGAYLLVKEVLGIG